MTHSRVTVPVLALAACLALAAAPAPAAAPASKGRPAAGPSSSLRMVLPFIRDDYGRALAEARARKVPIFIESWAPW